MFKDTRNIYDSMRGSGITVFGSILIAGMSFLLWPAFWLADKSTPVRKDFGPFNGHDDLE
jgi:hypothetical protein